MIDVCCCYVVALRSLCSCCAIAMQLLVAKLTKLHITCHNCKKQNQVDVYSRLLDWFKELNKVQRLNAMPWVLCAFDNVYTGYQCFTVTFSAAVAALSCLPSLRVIVSLCPPAASFCSSDKALGGQQKPCFLTRNQN